MAELEEINPWNPAQNPPGHNERVIIDLKVGTRLQFATWNNQSGVFTNAGGTQFKPEIVRCWLSVSYLPPVPDSLK